MDNQYAPTGMFPVGSSVRVLMTFKHLVGHLKIYAKLNTREARICAISALDVTCTVDKIEDGVDVQGIVRPVFYVRTPEGIVLPFWPEELEQVEKET